MASTMPTRIERYVNLVKQRKGTERLIKMYREEERELEQELLLDFASANMRSITLLDANIHLRSQVYVSATNKPGVVRYFEGRDMDHMVVKTVPKLQAYVKEELIGESLDPDLAEMLNITEETNVRVRSA